jgi:GNAT superfamily N-acetyltransferase
LTKRFPAHLHINLDAGFRSQGIGAALIEAFAARAKRAGAAGLHAVTGKGVRNVGFYLRCGFTERATAVWNGREIVFLGREL